MTLWTSTPFPAGCTPRDEGARVGVRYSHEKSDRMLSVGGDTTRHGHKWDATKAGEGTNVLQGRRSRRWIECVNRCHATRAPVAWVYTYHLAHTIGTIISCAFRPKNNVRPLFVNPHSAHGQNFTWCVPLPEVTVQTHCSSCVSLATCSICTLARYVCPPAL